MATTAVTPTRMEFCSRKLRSLEISPCIGKKMRGESYTPMVSRNNKLVEMLTQNVRASSRELCSARHSRQRAEQNEWANRLSISE